MQSNAWIRGQKKTGDRECVDAFVASRNRYILADMTSRSGNAFRSINEFTVRRDELVLRWVTACGQVNQLGM